MITQKQIDQILDLVDEARRTAAARRECLIEAPQLLAEFREADELALHAVIEAVYGLGRSSGCAIGGAA